VTIPPTPDTAPPLYGLVLAGGDSSRMGSDKSARCFHERPQVRHCFELLSGFCERVFVSVRPEHRDKEVLEGLPLILDASDLRGPIAGVASAMRGHPETAWLVLACDMPLVGVGLLAELVEQRDHARAATAFLGGDGAPEPLCAVYEPRLGTAIDLKLHSGGHRGLRRLLSEEDATLLPTPDHDVLESANTQEDLATANTRLRAFKEQGIL